MAFGKPSLKGRALRYLSQREHSLAELRRKLARHEETEGELALVLADLAAKDFISEARVVDSVLHHRAPRLGAARIRQELHAKGIAPEAVHEALVRLSPPSWTGRARSGAAASTQRPPMPLPGLSRPASCWREVFRRSRPQGDCGRLRR